MSEEKYITIKELQYELRARGLQCSRNYIDRVKGRGAPIYNNRVLLSEFLEWYRLGGVKKGEKK